MKKCPNGCAGGKFITSASEVHDWVVDGNGNFIEDKGCKEILHKPNDDNVWECAECGAEATDIP